MTMGMLFNQSEPWFLLCRNKTIMILTSQNDENFFVICSCVTNYSKTLWLKTTIHLLTILHSVLGSVGQFCSTAVLWRPSWGLMTQNHSQLGRPDCLGTGWASSPSGFSSWVARVLTWRLEAAGEWKQKLLCLLRFDLWNSCNITFATFCWSKQIIKPVQIQRKGK